jgi:hypothetical protein
MANAEEYWAEGTQAWFEATIRLDATSGVITRQQVKARDPGLAAVMTNVYGDGPWRYQQDCPGCFRQRRSAAGAGVVAGGEDGRDGGVVAPPPAPAPVLGGTSSRAGRKRRARAWPACCGGEPGAD